MDTRVIFRSTHSDREAVALLRQVFGKIGFLSTDRPSCQLDSAGFRAVRENTGVLVEWFYPGLLEVRVEDDAESSAREEILAAIAEYPNLERPVI
jgi:hypothetical protein